MFCMCSKRGEYAHKAVVALASHPGEFVKAREIARQESIPLPFLKKLIGTLRRGDIVETHTGRHGGIRLCAEADNLSLLDVVRAVEGVPETSLCPFPSRGCLYRPACPVSAEWSDMVARITERLRAVTVADLVRVRRQAVAPAPIEPR